DGEAPSLAVIALNDAIADGKDVSWIWDVDFEPLLEGLERVVAAGDRAAELALRCKYAGFPEDRIEVVPPLERALDRGLELTPPWRAAMRIRVAHLYPDYLNIYADRGNIAVLARRAAWRGHELVVDAVSMSDELLPGPHDLFYVGGGQDREQALVAVDLAAKGPALAEAVARGATFLAVCGGYQLLGRSYRDRAGVELPGIGLLPLHTIAGERRMIGDVLLW